MWFACLYSLFDAFRLSTFSYLYHIYICGCDLSFKESNTSVFFLFLHERNFGERPSNSDGDKRMKKDRYGQAKTARGHFTYYWRSGGTSTEICHAWNIVRNVLILLWKRHFDAVHVLDISVPYRIGQVNWNNFATMSMIVLLWKQRFVQSRKAAHF